MCFQVQNNVSLLKIHCSSLVMQQQMVYMCTMYNCLCDVYDKGSQTSTCYIHVIAHNFMCKDSKKISNKSTGCRDVQSIQVTISQKSLLGRSPAGSFHAWRYTATKQSTRRELFEIAFSSAH